MLNKQEKERLSFIVIMLKITEDSILLICYMVLELFRVLLTVPLDLISEMQLIICLCHYLVPFSLDLP